jgi:hypothetical protein
MLGKAGVGSVIYDLIMTYSLAPGKQDIEHDGSGRNGCCPPGSHTEAWLTVEQHPQAERRDIDHGKLVCELCMILQCCMEEETAHADKSDALQSESMLET